MDRKLRSDLIRLAHTKPEYREALLPLLTGPRKEANIPWAALAVIERERLSKKVIKLKGAYVNLREVVDIMEAAPERSGADLVFAKDLLEKASAEINTYLGSLRSLLGLRS